MPFSISTRVGLASAVCAAVSLAVLIALPYSRCAMVTISVDQETTAPGSDGYELGPLEFDLRAYREAPSLEPFREFQQAECAGLEDAPIALSTCLMDAMARAFPHGDPTVEFVNEEYVPAEALARHLGGAPGHCVTRSGLMATTLLAVGRPARVVQWIGLSHTMLEVWDGEEWLLFDPTSGVMLTGSPHMSALDTDLEIPLPGRRARPLARIPEHAFPAAVCFGGAHTGPRVYLEPWLYTRVGPRAAPFPYRQVAAVAAPDATTGYGQNAAAAGLAFSALLGLAAAALRLRGDGSAAKPKAAAHRAVG